MGWGESWDRRQQLASKLPAFTELRAEKADLRATVGKLRKEFQPTYELEIRADGVAHGVVATPDQIRQGVTYLDESNFPYSAKLLTEGTGNAAMSEETEAFSNDCHGEDGRFCEVHGVTHGGEDDIMKELEGLLGEVESVKSGIGKETSQQYLDRTKNTTLPAPTSNESFWEGVQRVGAVKTAKKANEKAAQAAIPRNDWGFTEADLQSERSAITKQFKRGEHGILNPASRGWLDRVDAETRAQAVAQGRVATKGEIKRGRDKARSANWGGLIALGLIVR